MPLQVPVLPLMSAEPCSQLGTMPAATGSVTEAKTIGSCSTAAKLRPSWKAPSLLAPSPKKQTATWSLRRSAKASPRPVTTVLPAPTIASAGSIPTAGSPRCIEPPLPAQQPVLLP